MWFFISDIPFIVYLLHYFSNSWREIKRQVSNWCGFIDCICRFRGWLLWMLSLSCGCKVVCYALCNLCKLDSLPFLLVVNWYYAESNMGPCCFADSVSCYWCLHLHGLHIFVWQQSSLVVFFTFGSFPCCLFSYCCGDSCRAVLSWKTNCKWNFERGFVFNLSIFFMAVLEA